VFLLPVTSQELDGAARRWLAQGDVAFEENPRTVLSRVLAVTATEGPSSGLAALRAWGDAGQKPKGWVCGADPVFLQSQLDRLFLRSPASGELSVSELSAFVAALEKSLPSSVEPQFRVLGENSYFFADEPIVTADLPANVLNGLVPPRYMPRGANAAGHNRLVSEVQMALYENAPNLARIAAGKEAVNSLWFWGGGQVPEVSQVLNTCLYSNDALLRGYWLAANAEVNAAPVASAECVELASTEAVVDCRLFGQQETSIITMLRECLARRVTRELVVMLADGISVRLQHRDRLRFWRRESSLIAGF
jgi:hypothetical protein